MRSDQTTKGTKTLADEPTHTKSTSWIPLCERPSLHPLWIFAICANQIAINFVWAPLSVLTVPMCTKLDLSNESTSLIMMIGSVIGLIIPPFVSAVSDSTTLKIGRRRIYLIVGELFVIIGLLLLSFCREVSKFFNPLKFLFENEDELISNRNEAVFYFVIGQILATVGGNLAGVPGNAMISDVVPFSQKVLASSICMLDSAISASISNSIGAFKLHRYFDLTNETFVLLVSCIIGIVAMSVSVLSTPEERLLSKKKSVNPFKILRDSVSSIDKNFVYVIIATFLFNFGNSQFYAQGANYVAKNIFGGIPNDPELDSVYDAGISFYQMLMLVLTLSQFFFSLINTKLITKIGFNKAWIMACVSQTLAAVLLFEIDDKDWLFIPYLLAGFSGCIIGSIPNAYVSLNAPSEKIGEWFTLLVLSFNVSGILSNVVLQMFLGSVDFFKANPGRLIALGPLFFVLSIICAKIAFDKKKKND